DHREGLGLVQSLAKGPDVIGEEVRAVHERHHASRTAIGRNHRDERLVAPIPLNARMNSERSSDWKPNLRSLVVDHSRLDAPHAVGYRDHSIRLGRRQVGADLEGDENASKAGAAQSWQARSAVTIIDAALVRVVLRLQASFDARFAPVG